MIGTQAARLSLFLLVRARSNSNLLGPGYTLNLLRRIPLPSLMLLLSQANFGCAARLPAQRFQNAYIAPSLCLPRTALLSRAGSRSSAFLPFADLR